MKNKVGMKIKDEAIIAAESVSDKVFKYVLKCILIQTVLATVVRITKIAEGVCFCIFSSLPWLLKTFPSMKVTLEKHFNINTIMIKEKTNPIIKDPMIMSKANMQFHKLSLFAKDSKSVPLKLFSTPLFSLGACNSWLTIFSNFVRSSMMFSYNLWFQVYTVIISKYYQFTKQIKVLILVISLSLCGNNVFAADGQIEQLIKNTEQQYSIPSGLLVAIAKIESGMNAYALNINGKSVLASNSREASSLIASARKVGISNIDVGIMQLNYRWHASGFASIQEMLNPQRNIEYAASFLLRLKKQHGTWHKALRYYHSAKPEHHKKYSRKVVLCWLNEQSSKF